MRAMLIAMAVLAAAVSPAAHGQDQIVADEIATVDVGAFPDITLIHADYGYPAGWAPHRPDGPLSRQLIMDLDGDGLVDQAEPVVHAAQGLYGVVIWFGARRDRLFVFKPPVFLFERYLTPDLDVRLTRQGTDIGVVASKGGPMDIYRWTGKSFRAVTADRVLPDPVRK